MHSLRLRHTSSALTALLLTDTEIALNTTVGVHHPATAPAHTVTVTLPTDDRRLRLCSLHDLSGLLLHHLLRHLVTTTHTDADIPTDIRLTVTATHPPLHTDTVDPIRDPDKVRLTIGYTVQD